MNALMASLGEMVSRAELENHFKDAPEDILAYIEMLGTARDLRAARVLPPKGRVDLLWELIQRTLKA
jgi:hypothetical protein